MFGSKVYAVLVTYNGMKWIDRCIHSILDSHEDVTIVLVDNKSTDGTLDYVESHFGKDLHIIPSTENLGFGKANNIGIAYCIKEHATHILLINQDVYITANIVGELLLHDSGNHVLTPVHYQKDMIKIDTNFLTYSLRNVTDFKERVVITDFVNAAFWLVPIEIIKAIGGFNPLFNHYGEDNNYCHRLKHYGYSFKIITNLKIIHDRNVYGNKTIFDRSIYQRQILINLLNINKSKFDILKFLSLVTFKMISYFFMLDFVRFRAIRNGLSYALKNLKFIRFSRQNERIKKLNWIK